MRGLMESNSVPPSTAMAPQGRPQRIWAGRWAPSGCISEGLHALGRAERLERVLVTYERARRRSARAARRRASIVMSSMSFVVPAKSHSQTSPTRRSTAHERELITASSRRHRCGHRAAPAFSDAQTTSLSHGMRRPFCDGAGGHAEFIARAYGCRRGGIIRPGRSQPRRQWWWWCRGGGGGGAHKR